MWGLRGDSASESSGRIKTIMKGAWVIGVGVTVDEVILINYKIYESSCQVGSMKADPSSILFILDTQSLVYPIATE